MTQSYIDKLLAAYPAITEVWLFGSQENGTAGPGSDWDYLVYSDDAHLLDALTEDKMFDQPGIDLYIVVDGDRCMKPWPDPDGSWKQLTLGGDPRGMAWERLSPTEALYLAARKPNPDDSEDIAVEYYPAKARRVHAR